MLLLIMRFYLHNVEDKQQHELSYSK